MVEFILKELLQEKGMSINKLSNISGISRQSITSLVNNTAKGIQFETLERISACLEVSPIRLLDDYEKFCFPIIKNNFLSPPFYECSVCENEQLERTRHKYCWICGSKIDWERVGLINETN